MAPGQLPCLSLQRQYGEYFYRWRRVYQPLPRADVDFQGFFTSWPQGAPIDFPHCNTTGYDYVSWYNDTQLNDGSGCWLKGAAARLFYWPEPILADNRSCPDATWTVPRQMAANASALVTTVVTLFETYYTEVPPTTVTMTSPTMYLSIEDLEGRGPSWAFKGGGPIAGRRTKSRKLSALADCRHSNRPGRRP